MNKKVCRKDVAAAAGVSVTAVTHALNATPGMRMSNDTREKIKRIAAEMGYRPSFVGRALVSGKNYMVGMLQPSPNSLFYSFYQAMTSTLVNSMDADDYNMLLQFRSDDFKYMRVIDQGRVDGMIILQSDSEMKHIDKIVSSGIPTVILNTGYDTRDKKNVSCIHPDYEKFTSSLLDDFVNAGCKKILTVIDQGNSYGNAQVHNELIRHTAELSAKDIYVTILKPDWTDFPSQVRKIIASENKWDGLYFHSYKQAVTFRNEALREGFKAGKDFYLLAGDFKNNPKLPETLEISTYLQDLESVATVAWKILFAAISKKEFQPQFRVPFIKYSI